MNASSRTRHTLVSIRTPIVVAAVVALLVTLLPLGTSATAAGVTPEGTFGMLEYGIQGEGTARVEDVDRRPGVVAPSAAQRDAVTALGATRATWNAFGTPHVLVNHGGYLSGPSAGAATDVARAFVAANRDLFRLSADGVASLELLRDSPLYDSPDLGRLRDGDAPANTDVAHVVLFRQRFGDLAAGRDGLLNVGVAADGRVAWVSSTVTGDTTLSGSRVLGAAEAVQAVAADVGFDLGAVSLSDVADARWTLLDAATTSDVQRARLVALPTPTNGVRQAWEVTLLASEPDADGHGNPVAHIAFVDAEDGTVWFRTNQVDHAADEEGFDVLAQAPNGGQFAGTTAAGACGPRHPFEVAEGNQTINVAVAATVPPEVADDDITINLYFGTTPVASQDVLTSPEVLTYSKSPQLEPGTYSAEVCPFNGAAAPPIPYEGFFTVSAGAAAEIPLPRWRVFPTNPNLTTDPDPSADTRELWCWVATATDCDRDVQNVGARLPWDLDPATGQPTYTTAGNQASTAISEASFLTPDTAFDRPAPDPTRDYQAPWENKWFESGCNPLNFATDNDDDASVYNLYVMHNRMHDWSYFLGFTEGNANLQQSNFGNDGLGGDPELGSAQAGRLTFNGRDNANQITLQDGVPGITNQYLWQPLAGAFYGTCTDGAYDMAIVAHEYAHAISGRMTAGPDTTLGSQQGQGESWSDLAFAEYFRGFGLTAGEGVNPYALAPLVTGDPQAGIRNYGMNFSPLNYSDIQYDGNGTTSPHADGEIWSAVNYEISEVLNQAYDAEFPSNDGALQASCARGERPADVCPGNRRWAQLMFDGFLLQPASPSMVDSRDAMLAADVLRFGGENQDLLWDAFARRGLGAEASSDGPTDPDPIASFASPASRNAMVRFLAEGDATGKATRMEVFVGRFEARANPVANTFDESEGLPEDAPERPEITDTAELVANTYEFFVTAPGYGGMRFELAVRNGQEVTVHVPLRRNVASATNGAEASGDGVNKALLIDDTEETNWASLEEDYDGAPEGEQVAGRTVTVDLAGSSAVRVAEVAVSAMLRPALPDAEAPDADAQSRFSALRSFDILACNAAAGDDCSSDADFTRIFASSDDAFDSRKPRPKVPDLTLRPFDVPDVDATHLRLVVRDNQCTGAPDYQAEANPVNDPIFQLPDCDSEDPVSPDRQVLTPPNHEVRAAELQAFSKPAPVKVVDSSDPDAGRDDVIVVDVVGGLGLVDRIAGGDRIDTAVQLSRQGFPRGAETAVVARSDDFPDALAAATLTAEVNGPLLLTGTAALDVRVRDELLRLGVEKVYLVGGETALAPAVESAAKRVADTERLAGGDRFETAFLIGNEVVELGGNVDRVIVARADAFPDALAAANLATHGRSPILLTRTGDLPEMTSTAVDELIGDRGDVVVVGGTVAVSDTVKAALTTGSRSVERIAGGTRYGTAAAVLDRAMDEGVDLRPLLLASGERFPDALTAGPVAHALGGALGLVHPGTLDGSADMREFLRDNRNAVEVVHVAGGPVAVSETVVVQLAQLLRLQRIS